MYSLVSAPVLGFDLTRLPGGAATAEVLLRGLCLTAGDLPVLAERLPDEDVRQPLWLAVEDAGRALPTLRGLADEPDPAQAIGLVQRAPIGNLDGLLRCVRHDVMSWTWEASGGVNRQTLAAERAGGVWNLLSGAVQALVVRDLLDTATAHRLLAPVLAALGPDWLR